MKKTWPGADGRTPVNASTTECVLSAAEVLT